MYSTVLYCIMPRLQRDRDRDHTSDPILGYVVSHQKHVEKAQLLVSCITSSIHNTFNSCSCICTTTLQKDVLPVAETFFSYSTHHDDNNNNNVPIGTSKTNMSLSILVFILFGMVVHDAFGLSVWHTAHSHQKIHSQIHLSQHGCLGSRSVSWVVSYAYHVSYISHISLLNFLSFSLFLVSSLWQRVYFYT